MYTIKNIELNLDMTLLEKYSEIICSSIGEKHFNDSISWLGEMMLHTESLEEAVYLYGVDAVSKKITKAIQQELTLYDISQDMEIP